MGTGRGRPTNAQYAKQVYDSAEAGAELAKRMQAALATSTGLPVLGASFSYADAATWLSTAQHQGYGQPGRTGATAGMMRRRRNALLPERLPDLPKQPWSRRLSPCKPQARLDIRFGPGLRSMRPSRPRV